MSHATIDKYYRIGDFARYMGVTPDFLKHYEEQGLLEVSQKGTGYRYYHFDQSSRILEYMRLRNYGVSVREMGKFLSSGEAESVRMLDEKVRRLERERDRTRELIEEHGRVHDWCAWRQAKPTDWEVRDVEPYCFLPHTDGRDFLRDPRVYELLKVWMDWMPVSKSALRVVPARGPEPYRVYWGLAIRKSVVLRHRIPVNDVVVEIPSSKSFLYHFFGQEDAFDMDSIAAGDHPMFAQIAKLGLKPVGSIYLLVEMKMTEADGSRRGGGGHFVVPIAWK